MFHDQRLKSWIANISVLQIVRELFYETFASHICKWNNTPHKYDVNMYALLWRMIEKVGRSLNCRRKAWGNLGGILGSHLLCDKIGHISFLISGKGLTARFLMIFVSSVLRTSLNLYVSLWKFDLDLVAYFCVTIHMKFKHDI